MYIFQASTDEFWGGEAWWGYEGATRDREALWDQSQHDQVCQTQDRQEEEGQTFYVLHLEFL